MRYMQYMLLVLCWRQAGGPHLEQLLLPAPLQQQQVGGGRQQHPVQHLHQRCVAPARAHAGCSTGGTCACVCVCRDGAAGVDHPPWPARPQPCRSR